MPTSIKTPRPVDEAEPSRGLLDTSVVVDLDRVDPARLPSEVAVSALTLAELAAATHVANAVAERARRQEHLQRVEATFDPLPFDAACARAYGRIYAAVSAAGRKARGSRAVDLMIAATALAHEIPLYTRNATDVHGLEGILELVRLPA